jgi:hypothetical protein
MTEPQPPAVAFPTLPVKILGLLAIFCGLASLVFSARSAFQGQHVPWWTWTMTAFIIVNSAVILLFRHVMRWPRGYFVFGLVSFGVAIAAVAAQLSARPR